MGIEHARFSLENLRGFGINQFEQVIPSRAECVQVAMQHSARVEALQQRHHFFVEQDAFLPFSVNRVELVYQKDGNEALIEVMQFVGEKGKVDQLVVQFVPAEIINPKILAHVYRQDAEGVVRRTIIDAEQYQFGISDLGALHLGALPTELQLPSERGDASNRHLVVPFGRNNVPVGEAELDYVFGLAREARIRPISFEHLLGNFEDKKTGLPPRPEDAVEAGEAFTSMIDRARQGSNIQCRLTEKKNRLDISVYRNFRERGVKLTCTRPLLEKLGSRIKLSYYVRNGKLYSRKEHYSGGLRDPERYDTTEREPTDISDYRLVHKFLHEPSISSSLRMDGLYSERRRKSW
jgi:hypothetical protein